jgi:hypothetical protein
MTITATHRLALVVALVVGLLATSVARADIGVGLYAPSAPFDGPVARLEFVSALAGRLGKPYVGRAYAKASDFAAAVKRGDIQFAVVDAPYLAALGVPYTVLAAAQRSGATAAPWYLVTSTSAKNLIELKGKSVAIPAIGAREEAFLTQVLFEGELGREHFGKIVPAPDALSALASVAHGRADAALVPGGIALPDGVHRVATLAPISWPVFVALPGASDVTDVSVAVTGFTGLQVFERFTRVGPEELRALAARFTHVEHRPQLVVPALHWTGAGLLSGRSFAIERPDVLIYLAVPAFSAEQN